MCEFADLQVNEHVTLEHCVVENQGDVEMIAVQRESLLAGDEGKTFAEFEQERLQVINEGLFEAGFHQTWRLRQPKELDDDRIFENISRLLDLLPLRG